MAAKMQLREKQIETLDAVRAAFRAGHRVVMLYGPTGFGKTEIAIALMEATSLKDKRAAMVMDRIVLCEQTSARLDKYGIPHGVLQSGHWRYRTYEKIQVCSAQTLEKRESFPGLNLLVIDEAHAQRKQTLEFIRNNPEVYVVGLSASPFTKGLGETYKHVVSVTTTAELVDTKLLVPLQVYIAKQIDMKGAKKVAGEWTDGQSASRAMKITGDVVSEWVKLTYEVFGRPRKTIVFCSNVAHGADLSKKFDEAGFNFVPISYMDTDDFKRDAVAEFSKPDSKIDGLIACDILTKGFDVSDVMIGVSARPFSKSFSSHVQQMGRTMRTHDGKEFALWICHSGNYLRFRDQWDDLYEGGVQRLDDEGEKTAKEPTQDQIEESRCPKCSSLWPRKSDICSVCGHQRVRLNLVEQVEGVMEKLGGTDTKEQRAMRQAWYSQLVGYGQAKGFAPGWSWHKFQAKFKTKPRGLSEVPAPLTPEVAGWIKSQFIALQKAKAKALAE